MSKHQDPQVAFLAAALSKAIKDSGVTRQALEKRMGLASPGYLSRILGGAIELRAQHIFDILKALGVDPGRFFRAAYPADTEAADDPGLEGIKEIAREQGTAAPWVSPDPDLDRRVRRSLARILFGDRI